MGERGKKQQPKAVANLKGTLEKSRYDGVISEHGVVFIKSMPRIPDRLDENGGKMWTDIFQAVAGMDKYIAIQDTFQLEELCYNYQLMQIAKEGIKKGVVIQEQTKNGLITKTNPHLRVYNEAFANFNRLCNLFGLSPSSRGDIKFFEKGDGNQKPTGVKPLEL